MSEGETLDAQHRDLRVRRARTLAIFALVAFALAFQGSRSIWDPDEGRYTLVALRMVKTGDWFTPFLHHHSPHFSKPPLTYWAVGGSIALLGQSEWAARLPNTLAFVTTVLLVGALARRLAPGREALAATIQATSLLPFVAANIVSTDTLLAAAETLAVTGFAAWRFDPTPRRYSLVLMWTGFGLAFLTKGPPGLLPLLAILVFVAWKDGARAVGRLLTPLGLALFALLAFGWYGAQLAVRPDLLGYLLGAEVVGRVASDEFDRNATFLGLLRTYPPVLLFGFAPWAFVWILRRLRRLRDRAPEWPRDPRALFLALWFLLPFAIFCLAKSRLPLYLLPLGPPLALALARALPVDLLAGRRARWALVLWVLLLLSIKAYSAFHESNRDGRRLAEQLRPLLTAPPQEIVFVNRKPIYSLGFYVDSEIERVELASAPSHDVGPTYRPVIQKLTDEIEEHELATVFLVPPKVESVFVSELDALDVDSRRLGAVSGWVVFSQPRPRPGAHPDALP